MEGGSRGTHSTTMGAMTLQGPHHTAMQSITITPSIASASWYSAMLSRTVLAIASQKHRKRDLGRCKHEKQKQRNELLNVSVPINVVSRFLEMRPRKTYLVMLWTPFPLSVILATEV